MKNRLIVILGPTATGKSDLAIQLARCLKTEIISGDSMYVYRGMNIGTAKPSSAELNEIRHHLVDILDPNETFSSADFQRLASEAVYELNHKGQIPILIGGTGLYLQSLLEGYHFNPTPVVSAMRERFSALAMTSQGKSKLYELLRAQVPCVAARIHPNDTKRIIRALELWETTEQTPSHAKEAGSPDLLFDCLVYGLNMDRPCLYARIDARVDAMMASGLLAEFDELTAKGFAPDGSAFQAIGYKELAAFRSGLISLEEAVLQIKQASRRFAKRQLTWFRRMPYIRWLQVDPVQGVDPLLPNICAEVAERFSIE